MWVAFRLLWKGHNHLLTYLFDGSRVSSFSRCINSLFPLAIRVIAPSGKYSINMLAKCKTFIYDLCFQWSKWLGPMYVKTYILIRRKDKFIGTFIDGCVFEFLEIKLTHSPFTLWTSVFTSFEKLSSNNFFCWEKATKT